MGSDEVQFPLDGRAEVVEIEIVQIVVEWIFDFLANFEESEQEERRKGSAGDRDPAELGVNLEGQEQEV